MQTQIVVLFFRYGFLKEQIMETGLETLIFLGHLLGMQLSGATISTIKGYSTNSKLYIFFRHGFLKNSSWIPDLMGIFLHAIYIGQARDAAARSYHQYEWSILDELTRMGFMEKVVTTIVSFRFMLTNVSNRIFFQFYVMFSKNSGL